MLKNFAFQTAKRELEGYKSNLELGNIEDNGKILAYHCLIISLFIKKKPILKQVYNEERDIYNKEISILVLDTNNLSNEFRQLIHNNAHANQSDICYSAGLMLLNQTLRCLRHIELTNLGKEIWSHFIKVSSSIFTSLGVNSKISFLKDFL